MEEKHRREGEITSRKKRVLEENRMKSFLKRSTNASSRLKLLFVLNYYIVLYSRCRLFNPMIFSFPINAVIMLLFLIFMIQDQIKWEACITISGHFNEVEVR